MFRRNSILRHSSLLDAYGSLGVYHGFSSREGGVSTIPHLASLNIAAGIGDNDETVKKNIDLFARAVSGGSLGGECAVLTSQIHSATVRVIDGRNAGEGFSLPIGEAGDGFVTDCVGVMPIVKTADCVPILLCGTKADSTPVIAAVHAGWRGTAAGIAAEAVKKMLSLGCEIRSIAAAIGPHIHVCCYEVGDDFVESVRSLRGTDFAARHIRKTENAYRADLSKMNLAILADSGVPAERCDVSDDCTSCHPDVFHSHRASHGKRGIMGSGIVIRKDNR